MSQTGQIPPIAATPSEVISHEVLDHLAARFRPAGLCLMMLSPQGTLVYQDPAPGLFFARFAIPRVQYPDPRLRLAENVAAMTTASTVEVWDTLPGVILAAFPHGERKHLTGVLLVAARSADFRLNEDVLRVCGQLGLDSVWLAKQAEQLPVYDARSISIQTRLLAGMLHDQVRLAGFEGELNSLSQQLANTYEELSLIYQLSGGMRIDRRASDFFKQVCLDINDVMGLRGAGVSLIDNKDQPEPVLYGTMSLPPGSVHRLSSQLAAALTQRKTPLLINDLLTDPTFAWLGEYARQLIAVPLLRQDQLLGCLFGIDKPSGEFNSVDSKLLNSIANESAIYLENAMLFEDVHGLMMGLLHSLTSAVDAKDAYTCGHSERVALLARHLAQQISLSDRDVERVYMAGLLHDVGKIGVPEAVLQKAGKLLPEEFDEMKKHPEIGARILSDIEQVADIVPGVLHHHERYDGKGYPHGLVGEAIPLMGRIICLADCFDAMTSNRTYRKALPLEVALTEIRRCSGTQFDPALAEAFLRTSADEFRELLRDYQRQTQRLTDLQKTLRVV